MNTFKNLWVRIKSNQKSALAARMATSKDYLSQIAHGRRSPSVHFKNALMAEIKNMQKTIPAKELLKND